MLEFLFIVFTSMAYSKKYLLNTEDIKIWVETADLDEKWNLTDPTADDIGAGASMNTTDEKINGNETGIELITPVQFAVAIDLI